MKQHLFDEIDFWPDLLGTWRVVLVICASQIIGGLVGHVYGDYWAGGAIAGLPATLLGLGWHYSARQRRVQQYAAITKLYVFLAAAMFAVGLAKCTLGPVLG